MTWVPCGLCGQAQCCCMRWTQPAVPVQYGTVNFVPYASPHLSDADVERIAKRLAELLKATP